MTPLTQQLEDKKKGCNVYISEVDNWCGYFNGNVTEDIKDYCPKCKEIIAILEQAIAEIENIQSQQQNDRKINLGETTLVDGMQTIVTQENISADISNLLQKQRQEILDIIDKLDGYIYCMVKNKDYLIAKKVKGGDFVKREELKQQLTTKEEAER